MLLDCMCHFCCCLLPVLPDYTAYMYCLHVLPAQFLLELPAYTAYLYCMHACGLASSSFATANLCFSILFSCYCQPAGGPCCLPLTATTNLQVQRASCRCLLLTATACG